MINDYGLIKGVFAIDGTVLIYVAACILWLGPQNRLACLSVYMCVVIIFLAQNDDR